MRSSRSSSLLRSRAALLVCAVALSGCGEDPVAAAAKQLTQVELTISGEHEDRALRGEGIVDLAADAAKMQLSVSAAGLEHARGEGLDVILIGDQAYDRDRFTEYDEEGEVSAWRESERDEIAFDPRAWLRGLRQAEGSEETGRENIRSRPATRYRASLPGSEESVRVWIDATDRIVRVDVGDVAMFVSGAKRRPIVPPDLGDTRPE